MSIDGLIKGLHHVTATVDGAQEDYDFYVKLLGQRLVKETVNFDNEKVYHFYYGNEVGSPSSIFTTFPYRGQGVRQGTIGTGQVTETIYSAPKGSLPFWKSRLLEYDTEVEKITRFGSDYLMFKDPSGLNIGIIEDDSDDRSPVWVSGQLNGETALTGVHHVTFAVEDLSETLPFLKAFGYQKISTEGVYTKMEAGSGGAGNTILVHDGTGLPRGVNGIGTVHHVAHRVTSIEDSLKIQSRLQEEFGLNVTEVKDRKYFKSIYFKIPGNVIFEVATEGPGFLVDESNDNLGTTLKLPHWQEPNRSRIEQNLMSYER